MRNRRAVVILRHAVKDRPLQISTNEAHVINPVPDLDDPFGIGLVAGVGVQSCAQVDECGVTGSMLVVVSA